MAAIDLPPQPVDAIAEWGVKAGELFQRGMTGLERRKWELCFSRTETGELIEPEADPRARAVGYTLCDASGNRVLSDAQVELLASKSGAVLDRLYDAAMLLSGVRTDSAQVKADQKNSEETSGSDSSTG